MIAYTSEEPGAMELYVQRFPSLDQRIMISAGGGYRPVWTADGKKLFFRYLESVRSVDVTLDGDRIEVSPIRVVHEFLTDARYDVDRTGQRILIPRPEGDLGPQRRIDVWVGWDPVGE
jgi:Tol biopolymer transport system component